MRSLKSGKKDRRIILSGQMTNEDVSRLEEKMDELFRKGARHLILDLKKLQYICSKGVAVLFHYTARGEKEGNRIGIIAPPDKVRVVFDMCGGESAFNMAETVDELAETAGVGLKD